MASISYSIGPKFDETASAEIALPNYGGPNTFHMVYEDFDTFQLYFENVATSEGFFFTSGLSNFALKYDFSDNLAGVHLEGGANGDLMIGAIGDTTMLGGAGDDTIVAVEGGYNEMSGGSGTDTLSFERYASAVFVDLNNGFSAWGAGNDVFGQFENLRGSALSDMLMGDMGNNVIEGWGGTDTIYAYDGDDRIVLRGADLGVIVDGGNGHDVLTLDAGFDYTFATGSISGVEQINIGDRAVADFSAVDMAIGQFRSGSAAGGGIDLTTTDLADSIRLGKGGDILHAGGGDDQIYVFDNGRATIDGGDGNDRLFIQSGNHLFNDETLTNVELITVRAGASVDLGEMTTGMKITSTSNANGGAYIWGTSGDDVIKLGAGGDQASGGFGDDRLFGGAGMDTFTFAFEGFGRDQVTADLGMDRISVHAVAADLDDLTFRQSTNGEDVVVTFDGLDKQTNAIILKGVSLEDVQSAADSFFSFW